MPIGRTPRKIAALRRLDVFTHCSRAQLSDVARYADETDVPAGYEFTTEGRSGREFFVVGSGTASVRIAGDEVRRLEAGEFFGEMSLIDSGPRTATVRAITPMKVFVFDARAFGAMVDTVPSVRRRLLEAVSGRIRAGDDALPAAG